jgi:preprotein translocase SecE subunit
MAKTQTASAQQPGIFMRVQLFFEGVRDEMKKVAWPNRDELRSSTGITLMMLGIMGLIVAGLDVVFLMAIRLIMRLG